MKAKLHHFMAALLAAATVATVGAAAPAVAKVGTTDNITFVLDMKALTDDEAGDHSVDVSKDYGETYPALKSNSTVTGHFKNGGTNEKNVKLSEGVYPVLPDVTAPEGWEFIGWYTQPVYHLWWNKSDKEDLSGVTSPKCLEGTNFKNLRSTNPNNFDANSWWWRRLVVSMGNKAEEKGLPSEADSVDGTITLYAAYAPKVYNVNWWWNNYGSWEYSTGVGVKETGCLQTWRDAFTSTYTGVEPTINVRDPSQDLSQSNRNSSSKPSYKFTAWGLNGGNLSDTDYVNKSKKDDGIWVTKDMDLYATYTWLPFNETTVKTVNTFTKPTAPEATGVEVQRVNPVSGANNNRLDPKKRGAAIQLYAQLLKSGKNGEQVYGGVNAKGLTWEVTGGNGAVEVEVSNADSRYITIKSCGCGSIGQKVTVTAKLNTGGKEVTSSFVITLDHSWDGIIHYPKDPTCTERGWNYVECDECHEARRYHVYPPLNHAWKPLEVHVATCSEPGSAKYVCRICGQTSNEITEPKKEHTLKSIVEKTCTGESNTVYCVDCGVIVSSSVDLSKPGHNWGAEEVLKAATCDHDGSKGVVCKTCGVVGSSQTIPADPAAHHFDAWTVIKAPTEDEGGWEERTCEVCHVTEKLELKSLGSFNPDQGLNDIPDSLKSEADKAQGQKDSNANDKNTGDQNEGGNTTGNQWGGTAGDGSKGDSDPNAPTKIPEITSKVTSAVESLKDVLEDMAHVTATAPDAKGNVTFTVEMKDSATDFSEVGTKVIGSVLRAAKAANATKAELVGHNVSCDLTKDNVSLDQFIKECIAAITGKGEVATQTTGSERLIKIIVTNKDKTQLTYTLNFVDAATNGDKTNDATDGNATGGNTPTTPQTGEVIHRLYNRWSGAHLITTDTNEKDELMDLGWTYEGEAGMTSLSGVPVYRLYNRWSDEHFFTTSETERDSLQAGGWDYEGEAWKAAGKKPMYRLYNPYVTNAPNHLYTANEDEYASLGAIGWSQEDIAWYIS